MAGCGSCAANAAARRARLGIVTQYIWTSDDGMEIVHYDSAIQAKAKVSAKGGSYVPRDVATK